MPVVLPPSMSRIYIHGVKYQGQEFTDRERAAIIVDLIMRLQKTVLKDLTFQSIKVINIHNLNSTSSEVHINNVLYYKQRVLTMDLVDKLRLILTTELVKDTDFSFEQINIMNDEYVVTPTVGYYDGE